MTPFQPAPPPDPLPGFTVEQAQAALDESLARRRHEEAYAEFARFDKHTNHVAINTWPQNVDNTTADTSSPTNGTTLTAPATTRRANTKRREG